MARARPDKSLAHFQRIALVLSNGEALGAYQAGAYAALDRCGITPNWIAASGIGGINAAIIAGNLPHERTLNLRRFWQQVSRRATARGRGALGRWLRQRMMRGRSLPDADGGLMRRSLHRPVVPAAELRELIIEAVDFERVNSSAVRLVLGAVNLTTGAETFFDNDRHVLTVEHVMAGTPFAGLPPVAVGRQRFAGSANCIAALEEARPADTLCFAIDGYDPLPGGASGLSRAAREIAAIRRTHDLRRIIGLLGERVPAAARGDIEIGRCLAEASTVRMAILHLVHEASADHLASKMADFSADALARRWNAGHSDVMASLAQPDWLAPPNRLAAVVVHEVRGGIVAPPR